MRDGGDGSGGGAGSDMIAFRFTTPTKIANKS